MKIAALIMCAILLGCTSVVGKIDWDGEKGTCQGIITSVGQHDTGCTSGGPISVPGATLIGGIFSGIADAARAFFGGGATTNINVTPEGVTLEE